MAGIPKWKREGYASEWQYRVSRAQDQGYDLAGYTRERRNQRAQAEGFTSAASRDRYRRSIRGRTFEGETERFSRYTFQSKDRARLRDAQLRKFKVSLKQFDTVRSENRKFSAVQGHAYWSDIQRYDEFIDGRDTDWSDERIGYILAYHSAMVNTKTNYEALKDNKNFYKNGPYARKKGNAAQYYYLVVYGKKMAVDEFEARYGRAAVLAARKQGVVKP